MKKLTCVFISAFITAALLVAAFSLFFSCRKTYICIEDELYEPVFELLCTEEILPGRFSLISQSEFQSISSTFAEKTAKVAAVITIEKRFAFQPSNEVSGKKAYLIKSADWLPVIADDLERNAAGLQAVPPDLDVKLKTVEEIASGERALTVVGAYAGDDGYNFRENTYAVCSILDGAMAAEIDAWCADVFAKLKEKNATPQSPAFVAAVGDIMVARGVQEILLEEPDGLEKVFGSVLPVLQKNHILIGNLEGAVTDSNSNAIKTYTFKFNKAVLEPLKKCGFNYFMLTNNHCYDYGEQGFIDTLNALKEAGIPTSGAGHNITEASQFYHTEAGNQKFSIISCGAYPVENSGFDGKKKAAATETKAGILWQSDELIEAVKAEKAAGFCVIVNVHGGEEYHFKPNQSQKDFYESLCNAGAAAVFGSHPHVLQPSVWHDGSLIVYSLGNFVFNGMEDMKGAEDSEIVRLGIIGGKIVYCEQYPAKLDKTCVFLKQ